MKNRNKLKWAQWLRVLAILLVSCAVRTTSAQTVAEITEKAFAATVSLEMEDQNGVKIYGSGFFVTPNRIATNYQGVAGAVSGTVKRVVKTPFTMEASTAIEGFTAIDRDNDLVLLKVPAAEITPLPLGDSDAVKVDETVYVAGNPLEDIFSDGTVSRLGEGDTKKRFQITAPILPGSSGGPVLNSRGEVIGVSSVGRRKMDAEKRNFAIPSNTLKRLLAQTESAKPAWDSHPVSADIYFSRGMALLDLTLYAAAIEAYTHAIRLKPDTDTYTYRGIAKDRLGRHFAALRDFNEALRIRPDNADAHINRGNVWVKLRDFAAALSDYDAAIRIDPDYAVAYINRGLAKAQIGDSAAALSDYDAAIRIDPDYAVAYLNRGIVKAALGDPTAAIRDWDAAIRIDPDYAQAYYSRGLEKARLGDMDAALRDYDEAIRINPDFAQAYVNRGNVKDTLGDHAAALSDYDAAIRIAPNFAQAYVNRGGMKGKLGDLAGAIDDYDEAIRLTPDDAKAYVNRGLTKADLGRTEEATQDFQTALDLAEQYGDTAAKALAEEMLRRLQ